MCSTYRVEAKLQTACRVLEVSERATLLLNDRSSFRFAKSLEQQAHPDIVSARTHTMSKVEAMYKNECPTSSVQETQASKFAHQANVGCPRVLRLMAPRRTSNRLKPINIVLISSGPAFWQSSRVQSRFYSDVTQLLSFVCVQSILEKAGIHPSNHESYPVGKVKYEIKKAVGTFPDIQCTGDKINEVHFCLERDLRVRTSFWVYL
jgi:hypothetical protein